jgi:hypothetical protein
MLGSLIATRFTALNNFVIAFLSRFRAASAECSEGLAYEPLPDEPLARFILSKKHFTSTRVRPQAFEPPEKELQLSVFRTCGLNESRIWELGRKLVAEPRERTLYARANLSVGPVRNLNLGVRRCEPPLRHADIGGWPASKSERMSLAQQLAAESVLSIAPRIED